MTGPFAGFERLHFYTQVPDEVFDVLMPTLSGAEFKVLVCAIAGRGATGLSGPREKAAKKRLLERGLLSKDGAPTYDTRPHYGAPANDKQTPSNLVRLSRFRPNHARKKRSRLIERDGATCRYCGAIDRPLQVEHLVPLARGGTSALTNLGLACWPCNRDKGTRTEAEYRGQIGGQPCG